MFVYLDNSSTTRQYDAVTELMCRYMSLDYGNPSSLHRMGIAAEKALKEARKQVASVLAVKDDEIFFTSGGTEADNMALFGVARSRRRRGNKIITSAVEHPAVLECANKLEKEGFIVSRLGVDKQCNISLDELKNELDKNTLLVSVMQVNNEVGTIQPIHEIVEIVKAFNKDNKTDVLVHTDAVQALGKMAVNTGADIISLSGHKIHGPKGIGAIYIRKGVTIEPLIFGGGQERAVRSGTENVAAIAGFGLACRLAGENLATRVDAMDKAKKRLSATIFENLEGVMINGPTEPGKSCCGILNLSFQGVRGEVLLHTLEQEGIYVSTGSACSSHHKGQSHVLQAMGISNKAIEGTIRFSFNEFIKEQDIDYVADKLIKSVSKMRKLGSFR